MKKTLSVICALMMCFAIAGCGSTESKSSNKANAEAQKVTATSIVLSTNQLTINVDDTYQLSYTVFPSDADTEGFVWQSADSNVAEVDINGLIKAKKPGQTTISISNPEGILSTCSVTVEKAKPDLQKLYNSLGDKYYCSISSDGNTLTIDTNPMDIDDYTNTTAWGYIETVNDTLELTGLSEQMLQTRSLDGRLSETYDSLTVTWSYHPDKGLNAIYTVK